MSGQDPIAQVTGSQSSSPTAPTSADPTTAAAAASTNASAETTGNTKFSSMEDLRRKNPKLFYQMMVGIATTIIKDMNNHQERLKKLREEGRNSVNG